MLRLPSTRRGAMLAAFVLVATASAAPLPATAQSGGPAAAGYGFPTVEQDPTAPITIWVDADRSAIAEAFQEDNPESR